MRPVCLLTGAGGRLGSALCAQLCEDWDIVAVYHRKAPAIQSQLRQHVENLLEFDPRAVKASSVHCIQANLSNVEDIRRVTEVALARFGKVDAIVNSAADTKFHGQLTDLWDDALPSQQQLLLNCISPFQLISAIHQASWKDAPFENAKRNRNVVNVSSLSALTVTHDEGHAVYSASKAAMNILSMFLALELAPYSVRVNALCPGRFTNSSATARIVKSVRGLLEGDATGLVLSDF